MTFRLSFSTFLKNIYKAKNSNITTQEEFVKQLFTSCAKNISYTDDYYKKILSGRKPLSKDIRDFVLEKPNFENVIIFFENNLDEKRLPDLFESFFIAPDEKKDLSIFSEALTYQFHNYLKYNEDEIPAATQAIYSVLLDQYGNGSIPNANEKALFYAKQNLLNAIVSLNSISVVKNVLDLQMPFDNFFTSLYKAYRVYEENCNLEGKNVYNYIKEKISEETEEIHNYLRYISEPGAKPVELIKEIKHKIYNDNILKDDNFINTFGLFDENEEEKLLKEFNKPEYSELIEVFFTQYVIFKLPNDTENLMNKALFFTEITFNIFDSIEKNVCEPYEPLAKINLELNNALKDLRNSSIQFILDGVYYPKENRVLYAPSSKIIMGNGNKILEPGQDKFILSNHFALKKINKYSPLELKFKYIFDYQHMIWKLEKYGLIASELYTFNRDGTYRLFLTIPTIKSRIYRLVRETMNLVIFDDIIGFSFTSVETVNIIKDQETFNKLTSMTTEERIQDGEDRLHSIFYTENKLLQRVISKEDSLLHKLPKEETGYSAMFKPLIAMIKANQLNQD